jgi:hypothetical protein
MASYKLGVSVGTKEITMIIGGVIALVVLGAVLSKPATSAALYQQGMNPNIS